jgi:hypothetical protein
LRNYYKEDFNLVDGFTALRFMAAKYNPGCKMHSNFAYDSVCLIEDNV